MMQSEKGNLFTRDDTFFGVCEGLGEDLRIPSNLFRLAFAFGFFFSPATVLMVYFGVGALVLVSRVVFPNPRAPRRSRVEAGEGGGRAEPAAAGARTAADDQTDLELPIAA